MTVKKARPHPLDCDCCRDHRPFDMPQPIVDAVCKGTLVIFAGAGVSTEGDQVPVPTLYDRIRQEMGLPPETRMTFPELMSAYCARVDSRAKLLNTIYERFQYIQSFPEIYEIATRFHRQLSTLHQALTIVTTNWDDYFERESGAVPFVTSPDFALWDFPGRKVFKIHGSINNIGSLVVTQEDYQRCYRSLRDGIMGSVLKQLLGTKTILYAGYAFADQDFQKIHRLLTKDMGALMPRSYILTLDSQSDTHFRKLNLTPIYTDAAYFISILKQHVMAREQMISDDRFQGIADLLRTLHLEHGKLLRATQPYANPEVIYALCYQDGMMHSFERMLALKNTGYYSHKCNVLNAIRAYTEIHTKQLSAKRYFSASYVAGYINGLVHFMMDDKLRKHTSLYYVYGAPEQPKTLSQYQKLAASASKLHKTAYARAKAIVKDLKDNPNEVSIHHPPVLTLPW